MIFVTVGTHEQAFDRLLKYMDDWSGKTKTEVVMQTGFSDYEPQNCKFQKLYPYDEMTKWVEKADIVITHGGPSSFIMPLQIGKIPIVVPRKKEFNEHVNDHQLDFSKQVEKRYGNIIVVEDISKLGEIIASYDDITKKMNNGITSNNAQFCRKFNRVVDKLFEKKDKKK